jgi:hypothetical protein
MLTRRHLLHASLSTGCAACAALASSRLAAAAPAADVLTPSKITGPGYEQQYPVRDEGVAGSNPATPTSFSTSDLLRAPKAGVRNSDRSPPRIRPFPSY